jgi:D-amino-acid oxidase
METVILGAGVSGLTCGVRLREAGLAARILTRELPEKTTSAVAAAIWYPFRVAPEHRVLPWARRTLEVYADLARDPATGVSWARMLELFDHPVPDPPWLQAVPCFRRARPDELPAGYRDGFAVEVPLIETPVFLPWLRRRFEELGGTVEQVPGGVASLDEVPGEPPLVVNTTGLGARGLVGDTALFPIRGQVVGVENPGLDRALADDEGPLAVAYTIPRSRDVVLGGTAEEGAWDLTPDPAVSEEILAKARRLEPRLAGARVLESRVGLRPGRPEVRLELEDLGNGRAVVHNYGHGGAGFTLCWGCAEEVTGLALKCKGSRV